MEIPTYTDDEIIRFIDHVEDELINSNMDLLDEMTEFTNEYDTTIIKIFFENN